MRTKINLVLFLMIVSLFISSCERDLYQEVINSNSKNPSFTITNHYKKTPPDIENFVTQNIKSITSKSSQNINDPIFDDDNVHEVIDSTKNSNYSFRFVYGDTPENIFYNLVVNISPDGNKTAYVIKYTCDENYFSEYKKQEYNFEYFKGIIELYKASVFFSDSKLSKQPCNSSPITVKYYPKRSLGSGDSDVDNFSSNIGNGSLAYSTGGHGLSTTGGGATGDGGGNDGCSCGDFGLHWHPPGYTQKRAQKSTGGCNEDTLPNGFIAVSNAPELQSLTNILKLNSNQRGWLRGKTDLIDELLTYVNSSYNTEENNRNNAIAIDMINQMMSNSNLNLNIAASFKSPMNIDFGTISNNTPEGAKFNEVYTALTQSPEFKKLFESIFKDSKRFNVKFEIADRVHEDNNPLKKEVHATTSQNDITKIITIRISKQILTAGTSMSQTKIENAKTILHECIHAYLFVKAGNPATGVDFVKLLNTMYPTPNEQHNFMYNNMVPTMQKVLGEIRDLVTTAPKRAVLESYTMHPTTNPLTSTPFNWQEFYKYISYSGLDETFGFKRDFPKNTDQWNLLGKYIEVGRLELDR